MTLAEKFKGKDRSLAITLTIVAAIELTAWVILFIKIFAK